MATQAIRRSRSWFRARAWARRAVRALDPWGEFAVGLAFLVGWVLTVGLLGSGLALAATLAWAR
jgi:hypothetical protein